jgi:hypothetical protein
MHFSCPFLYTLVLDMSAMSTEWLKFPDLVIRKICVDSKMNVWTHLHFTISYISLSHDSCDCKEYIVWNLNKQIFHIGIRLNPMIGYSHYTWFVLFEVVWLMVSLSLSLWCDVFRSGLELWRLCQELQWLLHLIVMHRKITSEGKNNSVMLALGKEETYIRW